MTLNAASTVVLTGTTSAPFTATTSDTVGSSDVIPGGGAVIRVVTTGTVTNVSILDPNVTAQGNAGTVVAVVTQATGSKYILIPVSAVNPSTGVATVNFSTTTGVTYDLIKF